MASKYFTSDFDTIVTAQLNKWKCPGISMSVVDEDEIWIKGYGVTNTKTSETVDPNRTLFQAASTTKAQLCAAWDIYIKSKENQARGDDKISWSTPMADIIRDDFVLADPVMTNEISLEDCVSHRSGLPRHELSYGWSKAYTVRDAVRNLRHLPAHHTIRTHYEYCNLGFMVASHALEHVTGRPLQDLLREWIWTPLGMNDTYAGLSEVKEKGQIDRLAHGHTWAALYGDEKYQDSHYDMKDHMNLSTVSGAAYVISTAADYAKWIRALMHASAPLTAEITKELWTPRAICPAEEIDFCNLPVEGQLLTYALGWFLGVHRGQRLLYHPGGLHGGGSLVVMMPEKKFGCMFLSNGDDAGPLLSGLLSCLLNTALGSPQNPQTILTASETKIRALYAPFLDTKAALAKIYPKAPPEPNIPLTLPLSAYAGTYHHMAYGPLTFTVGKDPGNGNKTAAGRECLVCAIRDRTWPATRTIRQINGELWIAVEQGRFPLMSRVESRVGLDGRVEAFGVAMEPAMQETLFWFERREDS